MLIWRDEINKLGGICISKAADLFTDSVNCPRTERKEVSLIIWDACGNDISLIYYSDFLDRFS